jgi:hypothetical protein
MCNYLSSTNGLTLSYVPVKQTRLTICSIGEPLKQGNKKPMELDLQQIALVFLSSILFAVNRPSPKDDSYTQWRSL